MKIALLVQRIGSRVGRISHKRVDKRNEKGFVLVPAVWLAGLIGIALSAFLVEVRVDTKAAANLIAHAKAQYLADGLVRRVAFELAANEMPSSNPDDVWRCKLDGDFSAMLNIQDQAGLIDLNAASGITLRELADLLHLDASSAQSLADRIIDFRDKGDAQQPHGAEASDYAAAGLSHSPKNRPFEHIAELNQVLGLTDSAFKLLKNSVTVYSGQDGIDPTVAPRRLKTGKGSRMPVVMSQRQSFAIDALVSGKSGSGFYRHAIVRVLRRTDKPFAILEWETGSSDDAARLREAAQGECPLPNHQAVSP